MLDKQLQRNRRVDGKSNTDDDTVIQPKKQDANVYIPSRQANFSVAVGRQVTRVALLWATVTRELLEQVEPRGVFCGALADRTRQINEHSAGKDECEWVGTTRLRPRG